MPIVCFCEMCNKIKITCKSRFRRFCSNDCKYKWRSIDSKIKKIIPPSRIGTKGNSGSFKKGQIPWNYRNITTINERIRKSIEYKIWRTSVFERDKWTCIKCGVRSGMGKAIILHADHIKPFALYPDLRLLLDNGRTLCIDCHKKTDTYGGKTKIKQNEKNISNNKYTLNK